MAKRYIDLSLTIVSQASWTKFPTRYFGDEEPPTRITVIHDNRKKNDALACRIEMTTQSFTHIDAPGHFFAGRMMNDDLPLEKTIGEAVMLDVHHKQPGEHITAEDLEATGAEVRPGDIAIVQSGWTDRAWGTKEFWRDMIGMAPDACEWLLSKKIKALVADFYPDIRPLEGCESCGALKIRERPDLRNHHRFLSNDIVLIEFVCNLSAITQPRVELICLPLKLKGTDGAPARVIAIAEV